MSPRSCPCWIAAAPAPRRLQRPRRCRSRPGASGAPCRLRAAPRSAEKLASERPASPALTRQPACQHARRRKESRPATLPIRGPGRHDPSMRRRVLIVDDNSAFRTAARQLLERSGFVVVAEAGTGVERHRGRRRSTRPDLAIVDVQLPDLRRLRGRRAAFARSKLRREVILTSSLDGTDFGALVASSSALGFIPKAELSASRDRSAARTGPLSPARRFGAFAPVGDTLWRRRRAPDQEHRQNGADPRRPRRRLGAPARGHRQPARQARDSRSSARAARPRICC